MAAGIKATIDLLLEITNKFMDQLPNYDQRKRKAFHKLKEEYENEKVSSCRDDNRVDNLRDELRRFIQDFSKELSK